MSRVARGSHSEADLVLIRDHGAHEVAIHQQIKLCRAQREGVPRDGCHIVFDFTTVHESATLYVLHNSARTYAMYSKTKVLGFVLTYRNDAGELKTRYLDVMCQKAKTDYNFVTVAFYLLLQHEFFQTRRRIYTWSDCGLKSSGPIQ